ncbi:thioredoxin family protein [Legionella maioricensis]|uniref:Thioredoxin family protein n=1 Tax=Legionella maioricensis TaxID=2896528 RepID=A0A9X2ICU9_9GAMM|nr:thioredoxin family protein [Legionella maioricensis]MCL9685581.1 thioredoxin family protein [Legionella maioricensis]MCL9688916.1 thioredoxin family protein [Legionella maioricensis]
MSKTASTMLPLGTIAPHFELDDVTTGSRIKLNDSTQHVATVLMFICNHCPYVKHINSGLTQLANDYRSKDIRFLAICSNDVENYPDDSPENMRITAQKEGYPFPYLYDETQEVAKAYNAACTPDFYVFDKKLSLVYRGQLDDSRPGNNIAVSGDSIRKALDCLINNISLDFEQKPSLGCNIKWK